MSANLVTGAYTYLSISLLVGICAYRYFNRQANVQMPELIVSTLTAAVLWFPLFVFWVIIIQSKDHL